MDSLRSFAGEHHRTKGACRRLFFDNVRPQRRHPIDPFAICSNRGLLGGRWRFNELLNRLNYPDLPYLL